MYKYSKRSRERLATCDPRLQEIMNELIKIMDVSIVCGHRTKKEQDEAYAKGNSKIQYPNSNHNALPSDAVDVAPYINGGIPWNKAKYFYLMAGAIKAIAQEKCINIRWGGDWDRDGDLDDQEFNDLVHFELKD